MVEKENIDPSHILALNFSREEGTCAKKSRNSFREKK